MKRLLSMPIAFVILVFLGATLWPSSEAHALPCQEVICDFYSDATYTEAVGERYTTCAGVIWVWGVESEYSVCETLPGLCPQCSCRTNPNLCFHLANLSLPSMQPDHQTSDFNLEYPSTEVALDLVGVVSPLAQPIDRQCTAVGTP